MLPLFILGSQPCGIGYSTTQLFSLASHHVSSIVIRLPQPRRFMVSSGPLPRSTRRFIHIAEHEERESFVPFTRQLSKRYNLTLPFLPPSLAKCAHKAHPAPISRTLIASCYPHDSMQRTIPMYEDCLYGLRQLCSAVPAERTIDLECRVYIGRG